MGELRPTLEIDVETPLSDIDWALLEQFPRLEPTGQQNRTPKLLSRSVHVRDVRTVGRNKHLKLIVDAGPQTRVVDVIAFSQGSWAKQLAEDDLIDLVYELQSNEWQGRTQLQLNVLDLRLSGG